MYYRLLGQLEVVTDDGRVVAFGGEKERVALGYPVVGGEPAGID